jgi:anti-sigma-K factor RskA
MPELTDAERMTKFETQLENLVTVVTRMDAKMDAWQANFVSKELLAVELKARDKEIERLEQEKTSYKNNLPFWASVVLAAIAIFISIWPHK